MASLIIKPLIIIKIYKLDHINGTTNFVTNHIKLTKYLKCYNL